VIDIEHYPGSQTLIGRLLRLPLSMIPKTAVLPILQGPLKGKRWIAGSGIHRLWLGSYEPIKMSFAAALARGGDIVFDIGANVGIYTLLFSERVGPTGQVVAFEPLPENLAYLKRHLELNHITNAKVVGEAITSVVGSSKFNASDPCTGRLESGGRLTVKTTTIDTFVNLTGLIPSLLKIDVEGAEAEVLKGAADTLRKFAPQLLLATHSPAVHQSCSELLTRHGYRIEELRAGSTVYKDELLASPCTHQPRRKSA
jgi:FkbM family methyltransferase